MIGFAESDRDSPKSLSTCQFFTVRVVPGFVATTPVGVSSFVLWPERWSREARPVHRAVDLVDRRADGHATAASGVDERRPGEHERPHQVRPRCSDLDSNHPTGVVPGEIDGRKSQCSAEFDDTLGEELDAGRLRR
jgi:hypothetical protein